MGIVLLPTQYPFPEIPSGPRDKCACSFSLCSLLTRRQFLRLPLFLVILTALRSPGQRVCGILLDLACLLSHGWAEATVFWGGRPQNIRGAGYCRTEGHSPSAPPECLLLG